MSAQGPSGIDQAAAAVLTQNEILLASPGNAKLHSFYPTPAECSSAIAQTVCNSGQLRITGNNLALGGSTNFHISSAQILDPPVLRAELNLTVTHRADRPHAVVFPVCDGWLYNLIKSIEITFSNSNLSNLILRKGPFRQWSLAQCEDEFSRKLLLESAGSGRPITVKNPNIGANNVSTDSSVPVTASLPLSFLSWMGASIKSGFPFDARTINGIIQVQINWEDSIYSAFTVPIQHEAQDAAAAGAAAFNRYSLDSVNNRKFSRLEVTFRSYQLMDSTFSVGNALAIDPSLRYTIPAKWLNSYTYTVAAGSFSRIKSSQPYGNVMGLAAADPDASKIRLELQSAPAGMLQAIGIHVRPTAWAARVDAGAPAGIDAPGLATSNENISYPQSSLLDSVLLQYSGQNIIDLRTTAEINSFMKFIYRDTMSTWVNAPHSTNTTSVGGAPDSLAEYAIKHTTGLALTADEATNVKQFSAPTNLRRGSGLLLDQQYILPLMHDGDDVMRRKHIENLPQYSGSSLTLEFTVLDDQVWKTQYAPAGTAPSASYTTNNTNANAAPLFALINNSELVTAAANDTCFGGAPMNPHVAVGMPRFPGIKLGTGADATAKISHFIPTAYEVEITYYIAALVVNTNGMVELQI